MSRYNYPRPATRRACSCGCGELADECSGLRPKPYGSMRVEQGIGTWDRLEAEALDVDARCSGCQAFVPPHRDLCFACSDADERTWGGDAA